MNRSRRPVLLVALLLSIGLLAVACSGDDGSGAARSAAGAADSVNVNEFCSQFTRAGFMTAAEIGTCFILQNETRRFSAPGRLDAKFELTVPKAECGQESSTDGFKCVKTGGRYGEIRDHQNGNTYGKRFPTPNPFLETAAVQFQSAAMWAGTESIVYIGSNQAPMSLDQLPAKAFFSAPYSASNYGDCRGNGEFITCQIVENSWSSGGDWMRPRYIFRTQPMQITINNNSGRPMSLQAEPVPGVGYLLDPNGTSSSSAIKTIPSGGRVVIGGYRSSNSTEGHSWTANYCIDSLSGCVPVAITIKLAFVDNKWVNQSTCVPVNTSATSTYKCNTPTLNDSDEYRQAIVSITNF